MNEIFFNEGNQIHNVLSCSGSGTVINYGSGSDFLTSYGYYSGSGSISQKVTVPTVPVPVPQHCFVLLSLRGSRILMLTRIQILKKSFCIRNTDVPVQAEESKVSAIKLIRYRVQFCHSLQGITIDTFSPTISLKSDHFACELPY